MTGTCPLCGQGGIGLCWGQKVRAHKVFGRECLGEYRLAVEFRTRNLKPPTLVRDRDEYHARVLRKG